MLYSDGDITHHIGLRVVMKTAKDVQDTLILKLSNLVVRV